MQVRVHLKFGEFWAKELKLRTDSFLLIFQKTQINCLFLYFLFQIVVLLLRHSLVLSINFALLIYVIKLLKKIFHRGWDYDYFLLNVFIALNLTFIRLGSKLNALPNFSVCCYNFLRPCSPSPTSLISFWWYPEIQLSMVHS